MKLCVGTAGKGLEGQAPKYKSVKQEMFFKNTVLGSCLGRQTYFRSERLEWLSHCFNHGKASDN